MKLEVIRRLVNNDGTYFNKGDEIYFTYDGERFVGKITGFTESELTLNDLMVNGLEKDGSMIFALSGIEHCSRVRYDYA
jgi:hypothetical protein